MEPKEHEGELTAVEETGLDEPDVEDARENGTDDESGQMEVTDAYAGLSHNEMIGRRGEDAAAAYLLHNGYEIVDRNWSCRFGEVDIVADDDGEIVFVEVKTRNDIEKGLPEDAVTKAKRTKYEKIAALYLKEHDRSDCYVRFDVISLLVVDETVGHGRALLRHHRSAFSRAD